MSDHALIAPSSAAAIVACPARVLMCAGIGRHMDGDTEVRDQGTAAHEVAEIWSVQGLMPEVGNPTSNGVLVTEHMQQTAMAWRDHVSSWGIPAHFERKYTIPQVPRCHGTADGSGVDIAQRVIRVADLKYGYRAVEPLCHQLACYAGGVAADAGLPLDETTTVHLSIYQPRAWHRAGPLRTVTVTGAQVAELLREVADAAYQALSPEPEARPGTHCATCAGRTRCKAGREYAHNFALPVAGQDPLPPEYAEQELLFLQKRAAVLNAYVAGLALEMEHHITAGYRSPVYELKRSSGALEWVPELVEDVRRVAQFMGHNIDAPRALMTPTQARPLLGPVVDVYARRGAAKTKLSLLPPPEKLFPKRSN